MKVVLHDIDLNFQVKLFKWLFSKYNAGKADTAIAMRIEVRYFLSDGATGNLVRP